MRRAGHRIVSTWHGTEVLRPPAGDAQRWAEKAVGNMHEIRNADALVLIASPKHLDGSERVPGGKFVEAGFALGHGLTLYTVGGVENGMLYHPSILHAADETSLVELLGGI